MQIPANELVTRLESGEPVEVVDIRETNDFDAWHIHGSSNLPAYDALRQNDPGPLMRQAENLPRGKTVVAVCKGGIMSQRAAELMQSLGIDALSLIGGIRGWGSVWTEAALPEGLGGTRTFVQVRRNGKGCLSYVFGADGAGAVVDPSVDTEAYRRIAEREGLQIHYVFETHVHADHVSRARDLCRETGATLVMAPNRRAVYPFTPMEDGQTIDVGSIQVRACFTPGHTTESTCYLVGGEALLTGDTLFIDAVGRPDLEQGDAGAESGARALYDSLHRKLLGELGDLVFYPAHYGRPIGFDGEPLGSSLSAARDGIDLVGKDEPEFVASLVGRLGVKPGNFETIVAINEGRESLEEINLLELEAGPNCCAAK
ncbi:MAG: MBL fold metallo-hydrolase [bacterium]|nr:MBL fold metallo-hydrolase [bacterium]